MSEKQTVFIPLSGFLGAGKTTLMLAAAEILQQQGFRVACVTNDQGSGLVDSRLAQKQGLPFGEVSGGCFCCRFHELTETLKQLMNQYQPDIILAEAVGSCTDLMATVIKPLQTLHGIRFAVKPLTTIIDPFRLEDMLSENGSFSPEVSYIFHKQMEEAPFLLLNKTDLLPSDRASELVSSLALTHPAARIATVSAKDGQGIADWLDYLSSSVIPSKSPESMDVDYDIYADGEARLGWLNASFTIEGSIVDTTGLCRLIMECLSKGCIAEGAEIAHLKLWAQDDKNRLKISMISNTDDVHIDLQPKGPWQSSYLTIWLNARMEIDASLLKDQVLLTLERFRSDFRLKITVRELECFSPSRPVPVYRLK